MAHSRYIERQCDIRRWQHLLRTNIHEVLVTAGSICLMHPGTIYFLEINPNCGILYPRDAMGSADIVLDYDAQAGGEGHAGFIDR